MKKHIPSVKLPDGNDIPTLELTALISKAAYPDPEHCQGVECITSIYKSTEHGSFPFKLSDKELQRIELALPNLPAVHARMSEAELKSFHDAYAEMPLMPTGVLTFVSDQYINRYRQGVEELDILHQNALRNLIQSGDFGAYSDEHLPMKSLGTRVYISRADAIKYLKSINMLGSPDASPVATHGKSIPTVVHRLDTDAPHTPKRTRAIGRIALKAAWQIQCEKSRPATPKETFVRLIEWWETQSSFAGGVIVGFDQKEQALRWHVEGYTDGKPFKIKDCRYVVKEWQKLLAEKGLPNQGADAKP